MAEKRRVVVTGIGAMTCLGAGIDANWDALINGRSGIAPITYFDSSDCRVHVAGECTALDPTEYDFSERDARRYDRSVVLGVSAAVEAIRDSGLDFSTRGENEDVCAIVGSGIGGIMNIQDTTQVLLEQGPNRVTPFLVPSGTPDTTAHTVALRYGLHGASFGVNTACASGNEAIITATRRLMFGPEKIAITGGTEAAVCKLSIATFGNMKALSSWDGDGDPTRISRPFDKDRSGFVMAEGAGFLVLETYEHAKQRGAHIYSEIIGCGQTTDAYHFTAPEPSGTYVADAITAALRDNNTDPSSVGYINAHGTSTKYNDLTETIAIRKVFGEHAYKLAVSSTKSMTGHMIAGCGGVEAAVCQKVMQTGILPPTINYETQDEELDLDYVPNEAREKNVDVIMSNNFGFGGHNSVVLFRKV